MPTNTAPAASFTAWTDGACSCNGIREAAIGGWGVVLSDGRELSGWESETTNQRMEITAAIKALEAVPPGSRIVVRSDLEMLTQVMTGAWKAKANLDLWEPLRALAAEREVTWQWVKGHAGEPQNERADKLAKAAVRSVLG